MKLKRYITEEYLKGFMGSDGIYCEIFVNPSKKEMLEVGINPLTQNKKIREIRFLADDDTKKLYTWSAISAMHHEIGHRFIKNVGSAYSKIYYMDNLLLGDAKHRGGKYTSTINNSYVKGVKEDEETVRGILRRDWKWVYKYIDVYPLLFELKRLV